MTTAGTVRILIADDHPIVRDGLVAMLQREPGFTVVGEARNGREAVEKARELRPDVILLDLRMPVLDGLGAMQGIQETQADARFIILTTYDEDSLIMDALSQGAKGYLLKDTPREAIIQAVHAVSRGQSFIQPQAASKVLDGLSQRARQGADANLLSAREVEVLRLIAQGAANKEIATLLAISPSTVKTYVGRIFQKLEVDGRTEAVTRAVERKIIKL